MGPSPGVAGAATLDPVEDRERTTDPDHERRARLNQRLRRALLEGAEENSRRRLGRGLTREKLERVLRHYSGEVAERREPWAAWPPPSRYPETEDGRRRVGTTLHLPAAMSAPRSVHDRCL
jgi:hypothetical protein